MKIQIKYFDKDLEKIEREMKIRNKNWVASQKCLFKVISLTQINSKLMQDERVQWMHLQGFPLKDDKSSAFVH